MGDDPAESRAVSGANQFGARWRGSPTQSPEAGTDRQRQSLGHARDAAATPFIARGISVLLVPGQALLVPRQALLVPGTVSARSPRPAFELPGLGTMLLDPVAKSRQREIGTRKAAVVARKVRVSLLLCLAPRLHRCESIILTIHPDRPFSPRAVAITRRACPRQPLQ